METDKQSSKNYVAIIEIENKLLPLLQKLYIYQDVTYLKKQWYFFLCSLGEEKASLERTVCVY